MTDTLTPDIHQRVEDNINYLTGAQPMPDHTHLATTQAVLTTQNHWTATEAAAILIDHYGMSALDMTPSDRKQALAAAIGHRARVYSNDRNIAALRAAIIADDSAPTDLSTLNYSGPTEQDPGKVPTVFDAEQHFDDPDAMPEEMAVVTGDD